MRVARFLVTHDVLRDALHLPPLTEIAYVGPSEFDRAEIVVKHPELPDVELQEGEKPPLVSPHFRKEPVVFVDWGIK